MYLVVQIFIVYNYCNRSCNINIIYIYIYIYGIMNKKKMNSPTLKL